MEQNQQPEAQSQSATIIRKSVELRERCVRPGSESDAARDAISRAEQALDDLSVNFDDWMRSETDRLIESRDAAFTTGFAAKEFETLYQAAHNLKGQASTLGYPFADEICASLCRLLDKTADKSRLPRTLVNQHVDAVRALVNERAKGTDNPKASILAKRLRDVTNDFVGGEIQRVNAA